MITEGQQNILHIMNWKLWFYREADEKVLTVALILSLRTRGRLFSEKLMLNLM